MSTTKPKIILPKLSQEELEFAENLIALQMPYTAAIQSFLDSFPGILDTYELSEELTEEEIDALTEEEIENEIRRILRTRFRGYRKEKRRVSYYRIKETQATIKGLLDCIPVASPYIRLLELEQKRQDKTLKPEQLIKVLGEATRQVEVLIPRETRSPFQGLPGLPGMPDDLLTNTAEADDAENQTSSKDEPNAKNSMPSI